METQPYVVRSLINSEMLLNINLKILTSLKAISGEKLSATQKEELNKLEKELLDFVNKRRFTGDKQGSAVKDKDFFLNLDKKSWIDT